MKKYFLSSLVIVALILSSAFSVTSSQSNDIPPTSFFINEEDGTNKAIIVVGADAAPLDVVSASYVAAKIGALSRYEVLHENYSLSGVTCVPEDGKFEEHAPNYDGGGNADIYFDDFRSFHYQPASDMILPYACTDSYVDLSDTYGIDVTRPLWDYDVATTGRFLKNNKCSYELITIDFSINDCYTMHNSGKAYSNACDQSALFFIDTNDNGVRESNEVIGTIGELEGMGPLAPYPLMPSCHTYPHIYPRHYWGHPSRSGPGVCDPVGGIQYRSIVDHIDDVSRLQWEGSIAPWGSHFMNRYPACTLPERSILDLYCDYCDVYFLGINYNALSFGTSVEGYDYMLFGTPEWSINELLKTGESKRYGKGWTFSIDDVGIHENKIVFSIIDPDGMVYTFASVHGGHTSHVPSSGKSYQIYDPLTQRWEVFKDNDQHNVIAFCTAEMPSYDACAEKTGDMISLDSHGDASYKGEVVFAVSIEELMIGPSGMATVEYTAYALDDYGALVEQIYPFSCDTPIEPTLRVNELEWYLDIFPADDIDDIDLDNDPTLFMRGNPNFDAADAISLEDDPRECYPMLELWLATPVDFVNNCSLNQCVELTDCNGDHYFLVDIVDAVHTDYRIDGHVGVYRKRTYLPTVSMHTAALDFPSMVMTDEELAVSQHRSKNLILIGGPVANQQVLLLVECGLTSFDTWLNSEGDIEYIEEREYGEILIVAGKDRNATLKAAKDLVSII